MVNKQIASNLTFHQFRLAGRVYGKSYIHQNGAKFSHTVTSVYVVRVSSVT